MRRHGAMAFLGMIVLIAIYVVVFASILIFFQTFKYHVWRVLVEEYLWNRVQDMPLSILSMDVNGQPFVMQMNKYYYKDLSEKDLEQFINKIRTEIITPQLLSGFDINNPENFPFWYRISINSTTFSETKAPDCKCVLDEILYHTFYYYKCSQDCAKLRTDPPLAGQPCWSGRRINIPSDVETICRRRAGVQDIAIYNMSYPFPLTFNGSWGLTTSLDYNVIHYIIVST